MPVEFKTVGSAAGLREGKKQFWRIILLLQLPVNLSVVSGAVLNLKNQLERHRFKFLIHEANKQK